MLLRYALFWAPVWAAAVFAIVLGGVWVRHLAGVGGDLAAQWAWADFAARHPWSAYDLAWYGGMHPASYSLLAPYLMAWFGVRTLAVAVVAASAGLLGLIVLRSGSRWPLPVALWGAFALWCNLAAGRVTFAIGLMFGLAALTAVGVDRGPGQAPSLRRTAAVAALALAAVAASPIAGLFVEVAAAALLVIGRRRIGLALAVPAPLAIVAIGWLFPFSGNDPIGVSTVVFTAGSAVLTALLVAKTWLTVRVGAWGYALGAVLTWLVPSPIGGNVQRLALLFGGVVLLAALCRRSSGAVLRLAVLVAAFVFTARWTVTANIIGIPVSTSAGQAAGLIAELRALHADRTRVEAVPMLNHWESWGLVPTVNLARGWNRQADVTRNPLFYDGTFTGDEYHAWLQRWAVGYIAVPRLPDSKLDGAARSEAAFIATNPSWLHEIWHDADWQLYQFTDTVPMADRPAAVQHADAAEMVLTVPAAGPVLVRIPWSPWLGVDGPAGSCLARDGDWTELRVTSPGVYTINARYRWPRGTPC